MRATADEGLAKLEHERDEIEAKIAAARAAHAVGRGSAGSGTR